MKILILGGAGYIGGALSDKLMHHYSDILVLDSLVYETRFFKDCHFKRLDVRNYSDLKPIIKGFDVVFALAGIVGEAACSVDSRLTYSVNQDSIKWLADNFPNKIIFPSTCSVYGRKDQILSESSETNPLSEYAESKLQAEQYLIKHRPDSLIFRLGTLFGLGDRFARPRLDLVVNLLTLKAARSQPLTVFGGEQWRPLLHVQDVASAMLWGLEKDIRGLYNLSMCNLTIRDIAIKISQITNHAGIEYTDLPFQDQRNYRVDNSKILQAGWSPKYTLEAGVEQMYTAFQEGRITNLDDTSYHNGSHIRVLYGKT